MLLAFDAKIYDAVAAKLLEILWEANDELTLTFENSDWLAQEALTENLEPEANDALIDQIEADAHEAEFAVPVEFWIGAHDAEIAVLDERALSDCKAWLADMAYDAVDVFG